jgi:hypothetical protein
VAETVAGEPVADGKSEFQSLAEEFGQRRKQFYAAAAELETYEERNQLAQKRYPSNNG